MARLQRISKTRVDEPVVKDTMFFSFVLLIVCIVCYCNSLLCGFCFDDRKVIINNLDLRPTTSLYQLFQNDFWGRHIARVSHHKSYRPLCILTFRWNYALHEMDPVGYHMVNMFLHWVLSVLLWKVFQNFLSRWESCVLSLLFMVHPVHTEAVTGIVGRAEILSAILSVVALVTYMKGSTSSKRTGWTYVATTMVLVTMATLCKEQGITTVGICCVYEIIWLRKININSALDLSKKLLTKTKKLPPWFFISLRRLGFLIVAALGLLAMRIYLMGGTPPTFTPDDNPAAAAQTPARQLTYWYLLPINAWLLFYPYPLLCDYTMGTIPLVQSLSDPRNISTVAFVASLVGISAFALVGNSKSSRRTCVALSFIVLPFIPASNLFFRVGFVVAERTLYIPSIGFSMLVAIGFKKLTLVTRIKKVVYSFFMVTVILHGAKVIRRNIDWQGEKKLFISGLHITTRNAKLWNNVGHLFGDSDVPAATEFFKQAAIADPTNILPYIYLGRAFHQMGNNSAAMENFRKAEQLIPPVEPGKDGYMKKDIASIYVSMARIVQNDKGNYQEAIELYKKAVNLKRDFTDAYLSWGSFLLKMKQLDYAKKVYSGLLGVLPNNEHGLYAMGVIEIHKNNKNKAKKWFKKCLQLYPGHQSALRALSKLEQSPPSEESLKS